MMAGVGDRVRQARLEAGLTQKDLVRKTGGSCSTLQAIEHGQREPLVSHLAAVAEATDRPLAWFLGVPGDLTMATDILSASLLSIEAALELLDPSDRARAHAWVLGRLQPPASGSRLTEALLALSPGRFALVVTGCSHLMHIRGGRAETSQPALEQLALSPDELALATALADLPEARRKEVLAQTTPQPASVPAEDDWTVCAECGNGVHRTEAQCGECGQCRPGTVLTQWGPMLPDQVLDAAYVGAAGGDLSGEADEDPAADLGCSLSMVRDHSRDVLDALACVVADSLRVNRYELARRAMDARQLLGELLAEGVA